jgi:hypothetical protein
MFSEEEFADTKGVTRIRITKKNRQHNGQKKKDKRTNTDLQNMHIKLEIEQHEPHQNRGLTHVPRKGKHIISVVLHPSV